MDKKIAIRNRALKHAQLFLIKNNTVRTVAKVTGYSRMTVFKDLYRIKEEFPGLFKEVELKLAFNKAVKHIRGGHSTQQKWKRKKVK